MYLKHQLPDRHQKEDEEHDSHDPCHHEIYQGDERTSSCSILINTWVGDIQGGMGADGRHLTQT